MGPLVQQPWAEVKSVVMGVVRTPGREHGAWVGHTRELSYVARLTDAERFGCLALVETHRRGTETAHSGCAVSDGAEWSQGFVDLHRPDAGRLLDGRQALGSVAQAGQARYGDGPPAFTGWCATPRRILTQGDPAAVVRALRRLGPLAQRQGGPRPRSPASRSVWPIGQNGGR